MCHPHLKQFCILLFADFGKNRLDPLLIGLMNRICCLRRPVPETDGHPIVCCIRHKKSG